MGRTRLPARPKREPSAGAGLLAHAGVGSMLELSLLNRILLTGLPAPAKQFKFCPTRKWHADFAYPSAMLLIEVDGGGYVAGRHTRGKGFEDDCERTSTAAALGYRVVRVTRNLIEDGRAVALIAQALTVASHSTASAEVASEVVPRSLEKSVVR